MNYIIITGASRGLGESLVYRLLNKENHIICVSRTKNQAIIDKAIDKGFNLDYYEFDLNKVDLVEGLIEEIFSKIQKDRAKTISLINNAGVVTPIKPLEKCTSSEIKGSINVNLISPMILISEFIKQVQHMKIEKRVINISSGAGKNPYYGWGCYCTGKAGMDMLTRCVGLEQEERNYPIKILSLAPGVIDTCMQDQIRSTNEVDFPQLKRFIDLKESGSLLSPNIVADKIAHILFDYNFENGGVIDLRK